MKFIWKPPPVWFLMPDILSMLDQSFVIMVFRCSATSREVTGRVEWKSGRAKIPTNIHILFYIINISLQLSPSRLMKNAPDSAPYCKRDGAPFGQHWCAMSRIEVVSWNFMAEQYLERGRNVLSPGRIWKKVRKTFLRQFFFFEKVF